MRDFNKIIKKQITLDASSNPQNYFPIKTLESYGFKRYKCSKSNTMFWSTQKRDICGDISVIGEYSFIDDKITDVKMSFSEVWLNWKKFIESRGYLAVKRFPCVARWRDDLDFNIASIIGFQPYVTKGLVSPPSKLVSIPQNCLRFLDIENVGITGRHHTSYTMIGQLAFTKPEEYNQEKYFKDLLDFFLEVCLIPIDKIIIHEDAWLGGGDCGASLEFFVGGLEIANQVYMWYDMIGAKDIKDIKPLKLKVLDMGMGQERVAWLLSNEKNSYESSMKKACDYLFEKTKTEKNDKVFEEFSKYSGTLNFDEVDDIDLEWEKISKKLNVDKLVLKDKIDKIVGIYSIADHTRTLLYALSDGALPSNVKGGYNLRIILRRCLEFITKFNWEIDLNDVIKIHSEELKNQYEELKNSLENIKKIIDYEKEKYKEHKEKVSNKLKNIKQNLEDNDFIKYYISDGITPEEIKDFFKQKSIEIKTPSNFFSKVSLYFESQKSEKEVNEKNKFLDYIKGVSKTELIYYEDMYKYNLENVKVLKEFKLDNKNYIILDKTIFYPKGGGQMWDLGEIENKKVLEVFKIEEVVIHRVE